MKYISKGMVIRASTEDLLFVTRCGVDFQLTGEQAAHCSSLNVRDLLKLQKVMSPFLSIVH